MLRVIGRRDAVPDDCDAVIVDESMGAGKAFDREFAKTVVKTSAVPVILAGGLTAENVGAAIRECLPTRSMLQAVSKLLPGIKDHKKIAAFMCAAREADHGK